MSEPTTTPDVVEETGAVDTAQPAEPTDTGAATQPHEPQTDEPEAEPAAAADDNLAWLKNKGIDPSDPHAMAKVAEMYRNAEKNMHSTTAKASELEKSLTGDDSTASPDGGEDAVALLAAEVRAMKTANAVNTFWAENPEAKAYEAKMTEIVTTRPEMAELVKAGYLSLTDLYVLAKGGDPQREAQLKQDGGREALEKVASKQQAKAVTGAATSSEFSSAPDDAFLKGLKG